MSVGSPDEIPADSPPYRKVVVWGPIVYEKADEWNIRAIPFVTLEDVGLENCEFSTAVDSIASVVRQNDEGTKDTQVLINPNYFSIIREYYE